MNVLITGVASGIGLALTKRFLENNHTVYGIDINEVLTRQNLISFKCDITNETTLKQVENYLVDNNVKLDMIINVAGIHKMASLVESNYDDLKKVIEINLCGTMLVNKTFHKHLTKKGKIIIVTSEVASFDPLPFNGLYNVSKTALEAYAQALRQELNLLGQKVITIQPGAIETPLSGGSLTATEKLANDTVLYQKQACHFLYLVKNFMGKPIKTEKLSKFIYKVSIKKRPKYTYKIHRSLGLVLLSILPKSWQCLIVKVLLNRK